MTMGSTHRINYSRSLNSDNNAGVFVGSNGLFSLISMIFVEQNMKLDDGSLYVFCNKGLRRLKMVFFDGGSGCYRNYVTFYIIPTLWIVKTLPLGTILAYPSKF